MTGCFTDNQPDFTWMLPYEEKVFTQYFMPYKGVGMVKNATIDASLGLEIQDGIAELTIYGTETWKDAVIAVSINGENISSKTATLSPVDLYKDQVTLPKGTKEWDVIIRRIFLSASFLKIIKFAVFPWKKIRIKISI